MTCRMAAGQQKKRLSSSNFHEQYRGKKKKKHDPSDYMLNLRSHIDLEWDDKLKRTVAKKEQVGVSWRDMSSFVDSASQPQSGVADVISVPPEIFSLVNLTEVLSYDVWAVCLSEAERKLLTQFLPNGAGAEQVVHSLLKGDNHHFGNPFIKWSSSLCSGDLHPDAVLHKDKQFRANRRAYYSMINMYHKSMLEDLKTWKERWLSSNDIEKPLSEGLSKKTQENLAISPEKYKFACGISRNETSNKISIHNGDNDRCLSYLKISKAQHQLLKDIKMSGDDIQSKSLTRILGDIKSIPVHPYVKFDEEERKRLHEHWLKVAKKDLPAAFEVFNSRNLQKKQWRKSVEQELAEKIVAIVDEDVKTDNTGSSFQEVEDYRNQPADVEDENYEDSVHHSSDSHMPEDSPVSSIEKPSPLVSQEVEETLKSADDFLPPQSIGQNQLENIMNPHGPVSSTKDMWQTTIFHDSHYHSTPDNDEYKSAGDLSVSQPQLIMEHSTQSTDLERQIMESGSGQSLTSVFSVDNGTSSSFCSFINQGRIDVPPSFPRAPAMLPPYSHDHMNGVKQSGLPFSVTNDGLSESSQFSLRFQQQHQLLEIRELRDKNLAASQILNKDIYPTSRYPSQGQSPSFGENNFAAIKLPVNGGTGGYNWSSEEGRVYNSWSGVDSSSIGHYVGIGGNTDGSLYSVLNNKLSTYPSYSSASTEQYIPLSNFTGGNMSSAHDIYGYGHQLDNSTIHDSTAAAPSLNTAAWMNIPHQNSNLHDSLIRPFPRP